MLMVKESQYLAVGSDGDGKAPFPEKGNGLILKEESGRALGKGARRGPRSGGPALAPTRGESSPLKQHWRVAGEGRAIGAAGGMLHRAMGREKRTPDGEIFFLLAIDYFDIIWYYCIVNL